MSRGQILWSAVGLILAAIAVFSPLSYLVDSRKTESTAFEQTFNFTIDAHDQLEVQSGEHAFVSLQPFTITVERFNGEAGAMAAAQSGGEYTLTIHPNEGVRVIFDGSDTIGVYLKSSNPHGIVIIEHREIKSSLFVKVFTGLMAFFIFMGVGASLYQKWAKKEDTSN